MDDCGKMIEHIWPTPIYYNFINNVDEVQQEIEQIASLINYIPPNITWGSTHKISNSFSENFVDIHNLQKTKKMIIDNLKTYCENINFHYTDNFSMTSWMTSFEENDYAKTHDHGYVDLSGVYYFKTNGNDGDLVFENYTGASSSKCFYENYAGNWFHKPMMGKILIFPGWIPHSVCRNTGKTERNSLSFNILFN